MKRFKKLFWIVPVLIAIVLISIWGINQAKYQEWERIQSDIRISSEEAVQSFEEAGLHFVSVENTTGWVSKAKFGEPRLVLFCTLLQERLNYVSIFEYQDWKTAKHILGWHKDFNESNSIESKGAFFSHGTLVIFIDPPNENLETQLQEILMDRYYLEKQETQTN